jgi:MFS family permease
VSTDADAGIKTTLASEAGGIWAPGRRPLTVGLVLAITFVAFEALAIATVLPTVGRHLGDLRLYGWVFSAFLLASVIGIMLAGTLADRVPLWRPMLGGLVLFAIGLVIGGTAPDMAVLVAGRTLQGLGAGVVPAVAYTSISRCYPEECRPRMFAVLSTAWVVPGLIGPAIAALVAAAVGWRWVFLGLLPLVIGAGVLVVLALRHVPPPENPKAGTVPYLAVLGVVVGAGTALAALSSGAVLAAAVGGIAGGALLVGSLRRLISPRYLSPRPGLYATIVSRSLLTCCFFAGDAYVPYAIVTARHAPTTLAALALTASTLTWTAGSWVQARFISRSGPRLLVRSGECVVACGLGLMGVVLLTPAPPALGIAAWALAGLGIGTAYSPLSVTTLQLAAPGEEGRATSALQLCDVLGQALGTGVAGAIVAAATPRLGHAPGAALAFAFAIAVTLAAVTAGARIPIRISFRADLRATASGRVTAVMTDRTLSLTASAWVEGDNGQHYRETRTTR